MKGSPLSDPGAILQYYRVSITCADETGHTMVAYEQRRAVRWLGQDSNRGLEEKGLRFFIPVLQTLGIIACLLQGSSWHEKDVIQLFEIIKICNAKALQMGNNMSCFCSHVGQRNECADLPTAFTRFARFFLALTYYFGHWKNLLQPHTMTSSSQAVAFHSSRACIMSR